MASDFRLDRVQLNKQGIFEVEMSDACIDLMQECAVEICDKATENIKEKAKHLGNPYHVGTDYMRRNVRGVSVWANIPKDDDPDDDPEIVQRRRAINVSMREALEDAVYGGA